MAIAQGTETQLNYRQNTRDRSSVDTVRSRQSLWGAPEQNHGGGVEEDGLIAAMRTRAFPHSDIFREGKAEFGILIKYFNNEIFISIIFVLSSLKIHGFLN